MTITKRQLLIDKIMETKYADDSDQYHDSNIAFLQSLSVAELQAMVDIEDDYEEDFDADGEVTISDYDDEENCDKDDDGNCLYCGQKCWEGEMCDEQQAGGFNND
jgi:hypothetical protein